MEQMKIPSILKAYPCSFVVAQAIKRTQTGAVELANVMAVCDTKENAITNQNLLDLLGIKTFLIPTMDTEEALKITMAPDGEMVFNPLFTPAEYAKIYRDYFGWD